MLQSASCSRSRTGWSRTTPEAINEQFLGAGGNVHEYMAAVKAAIDCGYITVHQSGAYLSFTQAGADLFA